MTRKHFEGLADILREQNAGYHLAWAVAAWLATQNPRFNSARFLERAGH